MSGVVMDPLKNEYTTLLLPGPPCQAKWTPTRVYAIENERDGMIEGSPQASDGEVF